MRVRCTSRDGAALPRAYIQSTSGYSEDMIFRDLTVGKEYNVYLLTAWKGEIWYYIDDDAGRNYPATYPAPLFEVVDTRIPGSWRVRVSTTGVLELAFAEWFVDPYFYDKLTDLREVEVTMFHAIKARIDAELR